MQNLMLEKYLNILKLKAVTEIYDDIVNGNKQKANFDNLMLQLLQHEINSRSERSISKKIKAAKFPNVKTLDNFDFDRVKDLDKESVTQLLSCNFIEKKKYYSNRLLWSRENSYCYFFRNISLSKGL